MDSGLVTTDLDKLESGHHENLREADGAINWAKFSMQAESLAPLVVFQARGNPIASAAGSPRARSLILDTPLLSEDVSTSC